MQAGDRVRYGSWYKESFGDRWPEEFNGEGTVEEASDNPRTGQQMCLVAWDREPFNPQIAPTANLDKVS